MSIGDDFSWDTSSYVNTSSEEETESQMNDRSQSQSFQVGANRYSSGEQVFQVGANSNSEGELAGLDGNGNPNQSQSINGQRPSPPGGNSVSKSSGTSIASSCAMMGVPRREQERRTSVGYFNPSDK